MRIACQDPKAGSVLRFNDGMFMVDLVDGNRNAITFSFANLKALLVLASELELQAVALEQVGSFHREWPQRRSEDRHPGGGDVGLTLETGPGPEFHGTLVDHSASGFRTAHDSVALCVGREVGFEHPYAKGRARVIWNRVAGKEIHTGFLVIKQSFPVMEGRRE